MTRAVLRTLVSPFGRTVLAFVLTAAAWAAWWILPPIPLRVIQTATAGTLRRISSTRPSERVVYWIDGANAGSDVRLISVDLKNGDVKDVQSPEVIWNWKAASDLSWVAVEIDNRQVQITTLPDAKIAFTIPALAEKLASAQTSGRFGRILHSTYCLTASPDNKRLALSVRGGSICEVWDIPSRQKLFRLENIHGEPQFSGDGTKLGLFTENEYKVAIWEVATGQRLGTLPDEKGNPLFFLFCPDNRVMVGYAADGVHDAVIKFGTTERDQWDTELTFEVADWSQFITKEIRISVDGEFVAFPNSKAGPPGMAMTVWNVRSIPPRCIDKELGTNGLIVEFDSRNDRFLVNNAMSNHLFDRKSLLEIPFERNGPRPAGRSECFSPDGRWVTLNDTAIWGASTWWRTLLLSISGRVGVSRTAVFDSATGQLVNEIRGDSVCAWPEDGQQVWMERFIPDVPGSASGLLSFEFRPIRRPTPPWWLWLVTLFGGVFCVVTVRQLLRRSNRDLAVPARQD